MVTSPHPGRVTGVTSSTPVSHLLSLCPKMSAQCLAHTELLIYVHSMKGQMSGRTKCHSLCLKYRNPFWGWHGDTGTRDSFKEGLAAPTSVSAVSTFREVVSPREPPHQGHSPSRVAHIQRALDTAQKGPTTIVASPSCHQDCISASPCQTLHSSCRFCRD